MWCLEFERAVARAGRFVDVAAEPHARLVGGAAHGRAQRVVAGVVAPAGAVEQTARRHVAHDHVCGGERLQTSHHLRVLAP